MSDILPKQSGKTSPLNAIRTNYLANINMTRIGHHAERLLFRSCLGRSKFFGKKCIRPVGHIKIKKYGRYGKTRPFKSI